MLYIGCHLSSSKGFAAMGRQALELGANTFQFFTRNPRGSRAKDLDPADAAALRDLLARHGFGPIVAHAPYTLNLCGAEEKNRIFARETMADDLARLEHVPGQYYNFHPGSHVGQGAAEGVRLIAAQLNAILTPGMTTTVLLETMAGKGSEVGQGSETGIALIADGLNAILRPDQATTVLLETMAGKGSEVGGRFEELRAILDRVELSGKVGVCLDTCHVSDGGYDIVHDLDGVLTEFDSIIGLRRLKAIHLNDSKNPPGSRKDRHACLGEGTIGLEALGRIVRHPALKDLPFCLETPNDLPGYAREIALMREMAEA